MPRRILIRITYIKYVGRTRRIRAKFIQFGRIDIPNIEFSRDRCSRRFRPPQASARYGRCPGGLAAVAWEACEMPAHGAVTQRHDFVRHAGVDERLRADDASGSPSAVDDDCCAG